MTTLEWTTQPPTTPGFYWWAKVKGTRPLVVKVEALDELDEDGKDSQRLVMWVHGSDFFDDVKGGADVWWMGPLPVPALPFSPEPNTAPLAKIHGFPF